MIRITLPETVKKGADICGGQVVPDSYPLEVWADDAAVIEVCQDGNRVTYLAQPDGTAYQITDGVDRVWLSRAGVALFGARWQSELARALGVSDRTMRRWIHPDGANLAPGNVRGKIAELLGERRREIADLLGSGQS